MKKKELVWIKSLLDTPDKWAQDKKVDPSNDRHCILTATNKVISGNTLEDRSRRFEIYEAILSAAQARVVGLRPDENAVAWNDDQFTTHEKIVSAFDKAIEKAGS